MKNDYSSLTWEKYTLSQRIVRNIGYVFGMGLLIFCFQLISRTTIWEFFWDAPQQVGNIFSRMVPPQWSYMNQLWRSLWDTLVIATLGTLGATIIAVPVAFLAARNTTPSKRLLRPIALLVMVTSRSINALIWALILVMILGPGVLAGVLAIMFRSVGFIAKLLFEGIEEIDEDQVQAIRATGASPWHILWTGVIPQIAPVFFSVTLYRWDINIRESSVLGLVGAGGIGIYLNASINSLAWNRVSVILLVILSSIVLAEWVTFRMRKLLI